MSQREPMNREIAPSDAGADPREERLRALYTGAYEPVSPSASLRARVETITEQRPESRYKHGAEDRHLKIDQYGRGARRTERDRPFQQKQRCTAGECHRKQTPRGDRSGQAYRRQSCTD